jgi:hypothetical protein
LTFKDFQQILNIFFLIFTIYKTGKNNISQPLACTVFKGIVTVARYVKKNIFKINNDVAPQHLTVLVIKKHGVLARFPLCV